MKSQAFADELPKTISKLNERIAALDAEIERLKLCSNISSEEECQHTETCSSNEDSCNEGGNLDQETNMAPNNNLSTVDMSPAKLNLASGPSLEPKDTKNGGKIAEDKFPSANRNDRTTAAKSTMAPNKDEVVLPSANDTTRITANWAAEVNMATINNTGGNIHFRSASNVQPTKSMMAINNTPRQPRISVLREG